jgi:hypothetical protein
MGRFISPDPSGLSYADPGNPQSFNLYSYALNNPLKFTDPTGLAYCQWDDKSHDDSANTGVEGAVNSGEECTKAGGTWSHADGLNDDGSQMGSEQAPSLKVDVDLFSSDGFTGTDTSGPAYDPDAAFRYNIFQGVAQRTAGFPTICSVGVFGYAGKGQEAFGVKYFRGGITEYDSSSGKSVGVLVEAGAGTAGGGYIATPHGAGVLGFKELGEVPFLGDAGALGFKDVGGHPGAGLYVERGSGTFERGVGAYASAGTIGECHH